MSQCLTRHSSHLTAAFLHNPSLLTRFQRTSSSPAAATAVAGAAVADDEVFMRLALEQAEAAFAAGEVPVGAVLVIDSTVVAGGQNMTEARRNPLCHAEMLCISAAAEQQLAWRLQDATLYSTLEPCPMCAGAILQARLARLVYGARQPRLGADGSWVALLTAPAAEVGTPTDQQQWHQQEQPDRLADAKHGPQQPELEPPLAPTGPHPFHPNISVTRGVLADECAALMKAFFKKRRKEQQALTKLAQAAASVSDPMDMEHIIPADAASAANSTGPMSIQCQCH